MDRGWGQSLTSNSSPRDAPSIQVEDTAQPLVNQEDPVPAPRMPLIRETGAPLTWVAPRHSTSPSRPSSSPRRVKRLPPVLWRRKVGEGFDPFGGGRVLIIDLFSRGEHVAVVVVELLIGV